MSLIQSILMGLIQGLTEFLPVSSSGHLAIFKILFHVETDTGILFDVLLHVGTLAAVFVVYYKDIIRLIAEFVKMVIDVVLNFILFIRNISGKESVRYHRIIRNSYRKFVLLIIIATIPTGIIGFVGRDLVTAASEILLVPGICLLITAVLLVISDRVRDGHKKPRDITNTNAFVIGICQGLATLPGLSRSGTTIAACVISGFDRKFAVKYSFILSIPAILGALVLQLKELGSVSLAPMEIRNYLVGMAVAAGVGYICIKTMLVVVRKKKFTYFAIYCLAVGALSVGGYFFV
ncbi:Undecaprenyl-diphosphatase [uncultured Roseburia sp.]|uniref:Undecaprenyl-diphosphatase n=1 Tax=Brotonthovivens ammoniilytica TaxID=2981725 RepID=A0ABT2TG51_9FIRM|nr:undecaprenyl-diphosphate phosphatase [Brotonthovivens ammoniilytica]MCU6761169.1 undecaprenyl-diphosphate phosphatase [Brotonthovivens ammoniilytica]SCI20918.1 Undecaprenyl-diphosphatase [uncultured Roseburia sp.]